MATNNLVQWIANAAWDIKALDLVILDLAKLTSFTDYFIICSGKSDTQVRAIADNILEKLKTNHRSPLGIEGYTQGLWVLLDFGEVVAHVFHRESREYYNLEKLWADAKPIAI